VNKEIVALREEHPDWWEQAQQQALNVQGERTALPEAYEAYERLKTPKERKAWREEHPEQWEDVIDTLDRNNLALVQNPYYTYFHNPEKYEAWWGEVEPEDIDVQESYTSFRKAIRESEIQREQGGEWTPEMERWFGSKDSPSSKFWTWYFNNKYYLNSDYHDDDVISAALSSDVRDLILSENMEPVFEEAMKRITTFFDEDTYQRFTGESAERRAQAFEEHDLFTDAFDYDTIPEDKEGEDLWWKSRTATMKAHPIMCYFFYYEKYLQYWGNIDLDYAQPKVEPVSGGGGEGGGGGGGGGGHTPPPAGPGDFPEPPAASSGWLP
jgi:hypothetical protein